MTSKFRIIPKPLLNEKKPEFWAEVKKDQCKIQKLWLERIDDEMPSSGFSSDDIFPAWTSILLSCWGQTSLAVVVAAAACGMCELSLAAPRLYKEPQWQIESDPLRATSEAHRPSRTHRFFSWAALLWYFLWNRERNGADNKSMKERRNTQPLVVRCKLVLVGDVQCGKTAMLQVLAKDCYPEVIMQKQL